MEQYIDVLKEMIKEAVEIQALWNGDNAGKQEDNAHIAEEIIDKCVELKSLIYNLND